MHLVHWFEIPVNDLDRARHFYETVFAISLTPMQVTDAQLLVFPMRQGDPGATGALISGGAASPSQDGPVVYFSVDDIDEKLAAIEDIGGEVWLSKDTGGDIGL